MRRLAEPELNAAGRQLTNSIIAQSMHLSRRERCSALCLCFPDDHFFTCLFGVRGIGRQFEIVLYAISGTRVVVLLGIKNRKTIAS
jgi:hypothetical protein